MKLKTLLSCLILFCITAVGICSVSFTDRQNESVKQKVECSQDYSVATDINSTELTVLVCASCESTILPDYQCSTSEGITPKENYSIAEPLRHYNRAKRKDLVSYI